MRKNAKIEAKCCYIVLAHNGLYIWFYSIVSIRMPEMEAKQGVPDLEWRPLPNKAFVDHTLQEKIEALVTINSLTKPLIMLAMSEGALLSMSKGVPYTSRDLFKAITALYGREPPFIHSTSGEVCGSSLWPINFVLKGTIRKGKKTPTAFSLTRDAERFALPASAKILTFCNRNNIPMVKLMGNTVSHGAYRRGYAIAMILDSLSGGKVLRTSDIELAIPKTGSRAVPYTLQCLKSINLIEYEHIKQDRFSKSEKGYAVAMLKDPEGLEQLVIELKNGSQKSLRRTSLHYNGRLRISSERLLLILEQRPEKLEYLSLQDQTGLKDAACNGIVSSLCQLGIYEYEGFHHTMQSKVRITDLGMEAYREVFLPIIKVSKDPKYADTEEFRQPYDRLGRNGMLSLIRNEEGRYVQGKLDPSNRVRSSAMRLLDMLREKHTETPFRTSEIAYAFPKVTVEGVRPYVEYLRKYGYIESVANPGAANATQKGPSGFYRLKSAQPA
jgi:hypothetical protein